MMRAIRSFIVAAAMLTSCVASAQLAVSVDGNVLRPGAHALKAGARLLDAVRAAGVQPEAYLLGAAWLHGDAVASQRELKVGLLFDLTILEQGARLDGNAELATLAARLGDQVRAMPVTGRQANTLDPIRLELEPRSNRPLVGGDRLLFPARPQTVTVVGAVRADCVLPFIGLRKATEYAADCPRQTSADTDWLYIIQPDGAVLRRGVALWNRDPAQVLAPGARIVVPLRASILKERADRLNDDLAAFLATQPLGSAGEVR
jgi:capsule biosynthesis protein GfcC